MNYFVHITLELPHFHISQVTGKFLNEVTREKAVEHYVVATIRPGVLTMHQPPGVPTNTTAPFFASGMAGVLHRPTQTGNVRYFYR